MSTEASPSIETLEQRVLDLEQWVSHLERSNHDLSDMVSQQWETIDRLTRTMEVLYKRITSLEPPIEAYKPPHY